MTALIAVSALVVLLAAGLISYRWSRTRKVAAGRRPDADEGADTGTSRTGQDTQAGRI